jgi:hypothetical protein
MARLFTPLFWLLMALNAVGLGVWFLLGLAAATPSHTPVLNVVAFFALPAVLLVGVGALYVLVPMAWARSLAFVVAALPVLVVVGGAAVSGYMAARSGESADNGRGVMAPPSAPGPQAASQPAQSAAAGLEAAIRSSARTGAEPVWQWLQAGASPNLRVSLQPVWFAALSPGTEPTVLPALLQHGADLKAVDAAGRSAVQVAAAQRQWLATAVLIEHGADWQAVQVDNGQTLRQFVQGEQRRLAAAKQDTAETAAVARLWQALNAR